MPVNTIMGLFAKSPIKPLQKHAICVDECCGYLYSFFEACHKDDWAEANRICNQIADKEKEADILKREIRLRLPKGLFLPVERTDLLDLLTQQDKLANLSKAIAERVIVRQLRLPAHLDVEFLKLVQSCLDSANQAYKVVCEFDELIETGFRGREVERVQEMIYELDVIEDKTHALQMQLRRDLREVEKQHDPVDVMFMYKVLELVGEIADQGLRVGHRLELMLARS
ncbi:TIGR00153 family protein [Vibrio hannami]|uniref:TIGR00153 family protein n=1 Tax=Vibrio hannami TaxID=2717094 RepID=UPI00240F5711|nr:TIGR00153 family protein [Vibrio hannami]MDG3089092.1 TIGR00153 family protein [Vibrio hannami]